VLNKVLGYDEFRGNQQEIIKHEVAGGAPAVHKSL
jgi:superfamily II DNA helicase RecQ